MSFFGKVDYSFNEKYLISAVLRRDGYSRLNKDARWGVFPGISAGWIIGKENFMEGLRDIISFAKIRASYGSNGNVDTNISVIIPCRVLMEVSANTTVEVLTA